MAVAASKADGKPIMIDFMADYCLPCKELEALVFTHPSVASELEKFTLLKVDVSKADEDEALTALMEKYGVATLPALRFITPAGKVLPCHAAETLTNMQFASIRDHALGDVWASDPAFVAYRGTDWMPEPCRSCDQREVDWGGCRCQAFAMTGDAAATDPACALSPDHFMMADAVTESDTMAEGPAPSLVYRRIRTAALVK